MLSYTLHLGNFKKILLFVPVYEAHLVFVIRNTQAEPSSVLRNNEG